MGTRIGLNLGCGHKRYESTEEIEWKNIDQLDGSDIKIDIRALPFEDSHADIIESIHVLEHFYVTEVDSILREWKRVLKDGGELILELPCMEKILVNFSERKDMRYTWLGLYGDATHETPHMLHKWCYSKGQLKALLEQVGFKDIRYEEPQYHLIERDMRFTARK